MNMKNKTLLLAAIMITMSFAAGLLFAETIKEKREDLYGRFGPKLIEAIVKTVRDEINLLRVEAGLPERTNEQVLDAIKANLDGIEDYKWMKPGPPDA